jgi:hypothetical protein
MFAIVRLVGFLENGGSQILPSSHAFHREHATEIHGLGAVEIERSSRTARGFARRWGLVSESLLQAERNCLSFLVLAKAGGFFEHSSASRR